MLLFGHVLGAFFFGWVRRARSHVACVAFAGFGNGDWLTVGLFAPDTVASVTAGGEFSGRARASGLRFSAGAWGLGPHRHPPPPNNSFKPTPHRGVNSVLYATLHAIATPPRGGLTQALGIRTNMTAPYPIALDHDRELAAEIGLLLSAYAIIDLFILHIYSVVSEQDKDRASVILGRIKSNGQRIDLIRDLLKISNRTDRDFELNLLKGIEQATSIRNQYAHAIYSQVSASPTGWRMSMWLSDGTRRKKEFKDINLLSVRMDGEIVRNVLESLFHFGGIDVAYG